MDWQIAFNMVFALALGMGGWIVGRVSKTLDRFDEDLRQMPEKYTLKSEAEKGFDRIEKMLARIEDKLDEKADKE